MKIKFSIDKQASLIAGIEVNTDDLIIDVPASEIPESIRAMVVGGMRGETLESVSHPGNLHGWQPGEPSKLPLALLANAGLPEAVALLIEWAGRENERKTWNVAAIAKKQESDKIAADAKATVDAEWCNALIRGDAKILGIQTPRQQVAQVTLEIEGKKRIVDVSGTIESIVSDWLENSRKQAEIKAAAEKKAAERAAELREAGFVNGQKIHEWSLEGGALDISAEPGIPYDSHRLASNWLATVEFCASSPGNLSRIFWDGKGIMRCIPLGVNVGDYIECASKDKKARKTTEYVRVLEIAEDSIIVREAKKPAAKTPDIQKEIKQLEARANKIAEVKARHEAEDSGVTEATPIAAGPEPHNPLAIFSTEQLQAEIARRLSAVV